MNLIYFFTFFVQRFDLNSCDCINITFFIMEYTNLFTIVEKQQVSPVILSIKRLKKKSKFYHCKTFKHSSTDEFVH